MINAKISVIMPVYNVEKHLDECLDSITGQTLRDIEIICVDDGSTDSSLKILKNHAEKDGRIRVIESANRGCGHARRIALREARGKYVLMSDSDDKYTYPEAFHDMYEAAEKHGVDLVILDYYFVTEQETVYREYPTPDKEVFTERDYKNPFRVPLAPWTKMYRKAFLDKYDDWYLPEENVVSGDMPLHFQAAIRAESMHHLRKPVYTYYKHRNSLQTTRFTEAKIRQVCAHFITISKTIREEYGFEPHMRLIIPYFLLFFEVKLEKFYQSNFLIEETETGAELKRAAEEAWRTKGDCDESEYLGDKEEREALTLVKACLRLPPERLIKYLNMKCHKKLLSDIKSKDGIITGQKKRIEEQSGFISYRDGIIKEQDKAIRERDKIIKEQGDLIKDRDGIIKEQDKRIKALQSETDALRKSWSYRIGRAVTLPISIPLEIFKTIRDCRTIKKSGLFDAEWYLEQNKDIDEAKADPVRHYLKFGWREGRNPSPDFDTKKYLEERPDVSAAGICPLVHYIKFGI